MGSTQEAWPRETKSRSCGASRWGWLAAVIQAPVRQAAGVQAARRSCERDRRRIRPVAQTVNPCSRARRANARSRWEGRGQAEPGVARQPQRGQGRQVPDSAGIAPASRLVLSHSSVRRMRLPGSAGIVPVTVRRDRARCSRCPGWSEAVRYALLRMRGGHRFPESWPASAIHDGLYDTVC